MITITFCPPSSAFSSAAAGTTIVSWMVSAMIDTRTLAPGFNFSPGFATWTHTSTVVVLGSTDGLTTVTLPARSPSGPAIRAGLPTWIDDASFTGIFARATTCDMSTIEIIGVPLAGISPAYTDRSATTPLIGLRICA